MLEKKEITKKLIKNMLINFIIFTAILVIFDFIIYNTINQSLYQDVDKELENSALTNIQTDSIDILDKEIGSEPKDEPKNDKAPVEITETKNVVSPRLTIIERDEDGNILNEEELGLLSDYISDIKFNANNLDTIYTLQIGSKYKYRAINYKTYNEDGEIIYLQVITNVDGESRNIRKLANSTNIWNNNIRQYFNDTKLYIIKKGIKANNRGV